jgi:hypothetical protein
VIGLDLETDPLDLERFAEMLADSGLAPIPTFAVEADFALNSGGSSR